VSLTVTVNEQPDELPDASATEQCTVVVPTGKVEPDAGAQTGAPTPGQLSLTAGAGYVTTAEHCPGLLPTTILAGQMIEGGCVSLTVTVKLQLAELADASDTEQLTVVVPFGKVEPDGGLHVGLPTPGQLSLTVGAG